MNLMQIMFQAAFSQAKSLFQSPNRLHPENRAKAITDRMHIFGRIQTDRIYRF